jgi:hypothetical protein
MHPPAEARRRSGESLGCGCFLRLFVEHLQAIGPIGPLVHMRKIQRFHAT